MHPSDFEIVSTNVPRTIQSAYAEAAGVMNQTYYRLEMCENHIFHGFKRFIDCLVFERKETLYFMQKPLKKEKQVPFGVRNFKSLNSSLGHLSISKGFIEYPVYT